jgi:DNA-binding GntR family transcriptional regulator
LEYFSLAEIAYKKIKEAILKHEIVPGQRLSHAELVLRLNISQTPIREALSRLAQEGYVTRLTNRGYRVSEMTAEEVVELFGLRCALESYCVDEAIRRHTPDDLLALERNVKSYRNAITANGPLVDRYLINKDFHLTVAQIAGNKSVCRILDDACEKFVLKRRIEGVSHGGFTAPPQRDFSSDKAQGHEEVSRSHEISFGRDKKHIAQAD